MGQSVFQYNRKVSHWESKSAPYSLKKTHRLTRMHALFKWDERVSWQRGLLNMAMGYDTPVAGDSENSDLLTRWVLPKGNGRDDDLGSLWLLSHQIIRKAAFIPEVSVSVCFLGAESPGWGGRWAAGGWHRGHVWKEDIWECEGAAGPKCRGLSAPGSRSQESRGGSGVSRNT